MNPQEEMVAVVDKDNRVTGAVPRHEMRARVLIHRAAYILVFNSGGELFVHKRTAGKDIYPGYYDPAAGGVVLAGEDYEKAAQRELDEELGIRDTPLTRRFDFFFHDERNQVWGRVFSCVYDGEIILQAEEIESGRFMTLTEVRAMARTEKFTPDGLYLLTAMPPTKTPGEHH